LLSLSDGSEELIEPSLLWLDAQGVFRVAVKARTFTARFSRQAQIALGEWLSERKDGSIVLEIAGTFHVVRSEDPARNA
jgi:hypothetical protein